MIPSERIAEIYAQEIKKISYYDKTGDFGHIKLTDCYQTAIVKYLDEEYFNNWGRDASED